MSQPPCKIGQCLACGSSDLLRNDGIEDVTVARLARRDPEQRERGTSDDDGLESQAPGAEELVEGGEGLLRVHGGCE